MFDIMVANYNGEYGLNYNIHISEEFKFMYFNNPKAGCTTTKASLNLACARVLGKNIEYKNWNDIHDRERNILKTPAAVGYERFIELMDDPSVFKFCILRESVSRVVSAYLSKLTWDSVHRRILNDYCKLNREHEWALNDFLELVCSDFIARDIDDHWRLQTKQVCHSLVHYNFIGLQDTLQDDLTSVLTKIFPDVEPCIFDVRTHFPITMTRSKEAMQTLSDGMISCLKEAYAPDIAIYKSVLASEKNLPLNAVNACI